ncbi:glycosyltransferase, partial [Sphingomonas sp.]|uniref:glycosyltransferase n=1 Tax=Sphingomonas sp. TaxID=28214 RepID=UPI003B3B2C39
MTLKAPAPVLVMIVNYRTPDLALAAARSVEAEVRALPGAHVVIVDNGSGDDSADRIVAGVADGGMADWCTALPVARNGGFAAGNNAALRWHRDQTGEWPAYAWLLNPDTVAEPGAMAALIDFLAEHPDA